MNMKTMTSKEAQNAFGHFLDTAQREPVVVTRRNRPVGVMVSMENMPAIIELTEREIIRKGVMAGLEDAKAGRGKELTPQYIEELKLEAKKRIEAKHAQ